MSIENKNIGIHNQIITTTVRQERRDGDIQTTGDVRRKYIAGSIAKLYLATAAFAISRGGDFNLEDRKHITLREFAEGD